jgi:hypothetical protein
VTGQRAIVRHLAQRSRESFPGCTDVAGLAANRAWYVIEPAQLVENAPPNARHGESAEGEPSFNIEMVESAHQAHCTGAHELIEIGMRSQRFRELPRHVVNQIQVRGEQRLSRGGVAGGVAGP